MTTAQTLGWALDATWRSLLSDLGVNSANVLRRAGLADDLLHQPSVRLSSDDYYRLWGGIEAEAADPLLPITLCQSVRSESFAPLLFAALCSPNLAVAAERLSRFKSLVAPLHFEVAERDGGLGVELIWPDDPLTPPPSLVTMELLFCVSLARMGTRERIVPAEVLTTAPPEQSAAYEAFLGVRMRRGDRNRVTFERADAVRPFLTSNDTMWDVFEPQLRRRLADLARGASTAERVRAALLEALPSGQVSMEVVSSKLALSKRTMQRRIGAEGKSYQQILNETRVELARHYLERTEITVPEISFLLGFDEPNSFYRAFRLWTGATPDAIRQSARPNERQP
ncbi:AraC family transcriptional regulator [Sphingomonas sp. LB2R24]|uniref:AraC family transcriptional regulator n=1 Tax=Sphingomonas sorbitolis TaxID=3096165 RepID=UPI002FC5D69F